MSRILIAVVFALSAQFLSVGPVKAGDTADRHILGYSKDARWFAFVEHGIQDGSGFPYANLYILDVTRDRWAPGTPVRVLLKDERATAGEAYGRLLSRAAGKLKKYGTRYPGRLLASRPLTEDWNRSLDLSKPSELRFKVSYPYGHDAKVRANAFAVGDKSACDDLWAPMGLSLSIGTGDEPAREIYRDKRLPKSRACAQGYALADVYGAPVAPFGSKKGKAVALVYVFTHGFEGKDARVIAIPFDMPAAR